MLPEKAKRSLLHFRLKLHKAHNNKDCMGLIADPIMCADALSKMCVPQSKRLFLVLSREARLFRYLNSNALNAN